MVFLAIFSFPKLTLIYFHSLSHTTDFFFLYVFLCDPAPSPYKSLSSLRLSPSLIGITF
jgi:hypothetical protein